MRVKQDWSLKPTVTPRATPTPRTSWWLVPPERFAQAAREAQKHMQPDRDTTAYPGPSGRDV